MKTKLYGIYDILAETLVANIIHVQKHDSVAIRMFTDIAKDTNPNNQIAIHLHDYNLVALGTLSDDGKTIEPKFETILEGTVLHATIHAQPDNLKLEA